MNTLSLKPDGSKESGACECCGNQTKTVWGFVNRDGGAHAVYYARWTVGHLERGAIFLLSIGGWGGGTPAQRQAVALECRVDETGLNFMVVDAAGSPWGKRELLGRMLRRKQVMSLTSSRLRQEAFAIVDLVVSEDARVAEFLVSPTQLDGPA